jgi:o-succinylbenzoate synthase
MKIVNAEIFRFSIPLIKPLKIKSTSLTERNGLLLKLTDSHSNTAFGEIPPLPGFHLETLDQAEQQLLSHLDDLKCEYPDKPGKSFNLITDELGEKSLFPSVRFGIEMAIWNLMSPTNHNQQKIKVNGLLEGTPEEMLTTTKALLNKGYNVLKLKVGRGDIDSEIGFIHHLRKTFGGKFKLRLDANQSWEFDEAIYFSNNIEPEQIDYIEEPLKEFQRLGELYHITNLPFAIDESLFELKELPTKTKALIIKPSFVGGIQKTSELIKLAQSKGIQPVISSSFESSLGLLTLARFASLVPGNVAMGLDTFRWFRNDLIEPPFNVKNGFVEFSPTTDNITLNYSLLEKIY